MHDFGGCKLENVSESFIDVLSMINQKHKIVKLFLCYGMMRLLCGSLVQRLNWCNEMKIEMIVKITGLLCATFVYQTEKLLCKVKG